MIVKLTWIQGQNSRSHEQTKPFESPKCCTTTTRKLTWISARAHRMKSRTWRIVSRERKRQDEPIPPISSEVLAAEAVAARCWKEKLTIGATRRIEIWERRRERDRDWEMAVREIWSPMRMFRGGPFLKGGRREERALVFCTCVRALNWLSSSKSNGRWRGGIPLDN